MYTTTTTTSSSSKAEDSIDQEHNQEKITVRSLKERSDFLHGLHE
jgi:hypothetical protein